MATPERQRPIDSPITLTPVVETIGPRSPKGPEPADGVPLSSEREEWRRRSVRFPVELIDRAKRAQRISAVHDDGYDCLNALIVGAVEHELDRIAAQHNGGQEIEPLTTAPGARYRYGSPPRSDR